MLKHFHISDPGLAPPGFTGLDYSVIGKALSGSLYDGLVSIEKYLSCDN
jgi:sugar phosphate isomerase/epimerase